MTAEQDQAYLNELVLWVCLRHNNIVPFIGTSSTSEVSLVSEWMAEGTITSFLRQMPDANRTNHVRESPALY